MIAVGVFCFLLFIQSTHAFSTINSNGRSKCCVRVNLKQQLSRHCHDDTYDNYGDHDNNGINEGNLISSNILVNNSRRSLLAASLAGGLFMSPKSAMAASTTAKEQRREQTRDGREDNNEPDITHRVYMNVRISRKDGTFYVRDDLDTSLPENNVYYGKLIFNLYGNIAPNHVKQFLSYVSDISPITDDNVMPSYGRSNFVSLDQSSGLLVGGYIPSLKTTSIVSGSTSLQYGDRILNAPLWIETSPTTKKLSHDRKGLLTHRLLDVLPTFAITTRSNTDLDSSHYVFGSLDFQGAKDGLEFLNIVQDIPTYSVDRPSSYKDSENEVVNSVATSVFNTQREFFRSTAKTFGDTRLDKLYDGKFLRRVEVTQVGLL